MHIELNQILFCLFLNNKVNQPFSWYICR